MRITNWSGRRMALVTIMAIVMHASPPPAGAIGSEGRPYDKELLRLSELLGAIHYLRELCGAGEGQQWRQGMQDLVSAEGTTAFRRAQLVQSFNKGYRSYRRTYRNCTKSARTAIQRFLSEGIQLSEEMVKKNQ